MKTDKMQNTAITSFRGKYAFLSNFYEALIEYNGFHFRNKKVHLRQDWEDAKVRIMYEICLAKFSQHPKLKERLLATRDAFIEEGNDWGDTEWGVCNGYGKNRLGKILMLVRMDLQPDKYCKERMRCRKTENKG